MRYLWINRSNKPNIAALSEFFLSIATGVVVIFHQKFIGPLIIQKSSFNLQPCMLILIILSLLKSTYLSVFILCCPSDKKEKEEKEPLKKLEASRLIYPGLIKAGVYLSITTLISTGRNMSTTIIIGLILSFCFWLNFCPKDNKIVQILLKGRNYSQDKIKSSILYVLLLISICLQPAEYLFKYQLHLEIFFIFTAVLLIFSYFYLHKLVLSYGIKQKNPRILLWQCLFETLFLLFVILYLALMNTQGTALSDQFWYLLDKWWIILLMSLLNTLYEMVLLQHLKKVAFPQIFSTLTSGFIWFNIFYMADKQIDAKLYISVIIMFAVLLVNIGLISRDNLKILKRLNSWGKKKSSKNKFKEFQNQNENNQNDQ